MLDFGRHRHSLPPNLLAFDIQIMDYFIVKIETKIIIKDAREKQTDVNLSINYLLQKWKYPGQGTNN